MTKTLTRLALAALAASFCSPAAGARVPAPVAARASASQSAAPAASDWVTVSPAGEVTNITVSTSMPHGVTEKAVAALRAVKFTPAQKDGRAVSQDAAFEYNFNIY